MSKISKNKKRTKIKYTLLFPTMIIAVLLGLHYLGLLNELIIGIAYYPKTTITLLIVILFNPTIYMLNNKITIKKYIITIFLYFLPIILLLNLHFSLSTYNHDSFIKGSEIIKNHHFELSENQLFYYDKYSDNTFSYDSSRSFNDHYMVKDYIIIPKYLTNFAVEKISKKTNKRIIQKNLKKEKEMLEYKEREKKVNSILEKNGVLKN